MPPKINHEIRHFLKGFTDEKSLVPVTVIFDPEHDAVTIAGTGGKFSLSVDDLDLLQELIAKAIELRNEGGWSREFMQ